MAASQCALCTPLFTAAGRCGVGAVASVDGPLRELTFLGTNEPAAQVSWAAARGARCTRTVRAVCVGQAEGWGVTALLMTLCLLPTTDRVRAMYSNRHVCHSRGLIATPLPHLHHRPRNWGEARMRAGATGGEAGARHVRKVQV